MLRTDRLERLLNRRVPLEKRVKTFSEVFGEATLNRDHEYLVRSMQPIEAEYTENTFREAERVQSQLAGGLPGHFRATYDYQGSVTSDTHIRVHSDVDLLVFHGGFTTVDVVTPNFSPYLGDTLAELAALRRSAVTVFKEKFPAVTVDDKPGKSVSLNGGSLRRKIDVIVGNWWDTQIYKQHGWKPARGINILDSKVPREVKNKPFLHNYRLDDKDGKTGGLRKVIRLLKTLKYDAEPELKISSYDIAALAYNMTEQALSVPENGYLTLARNAQGELRRFVDNPSVRDALMVPNDTRRVFGSEGASLEGLKALLAELTELLGSIQRTMANRIFSLGAQPERIVGRPWREVRPPSVKMYMY